MNLDSAVAAWRAAGAGCAAMVGDWWQVERAAAALAAEAPVVRLTAELLARVEEVEELAAWDARQHPPGGESDAARREALLRQGRMQDRLGAAFAAWLAELPAGKPVVVRDFELAVAERLDLTRLGELTQPTLLLVPGEIDGTLVRIFGSKTQRGLPLPPALAPPARVWALEDGPEETG